MLNLRGGKKRERKIALLTPFSPDGGGGAAQLRSILAQLDDLHVEWYYLAPAEARSRRGRWLGHPLAPAAFICDLVARAALPAGSSPAVRNLVKGIEADTYWVVAHNEGVCIASELCASEKRVHLTVHDDPVGIFHRSNKYFALSPLMSIVFGRVLRCATTVDVTSTGMRDIYKHRYGIQSFALFRHVPSLRKPKYMLKPDTLRVGHIGTLYHAEPFIKFLKACRHYASSQGRQLRVLRIGTSPQIDRVALENADIFESEGEMTEETAIEKLATCDFCYAMYPFGSRSKLFRQSSFPVKVATYVQAQRPIFAHTPSDSTLARAVTTYSVGQVCPTNRTLEIISSISELLSRPITQAQFEEFRADILGSSHIGELKASLRGEEHTTAG